MIGKGVVAKGRFFSGVKKPVRVISGVTPIAVMTAPLPCPGRCIYCPGGPQMNTPKSYLPDSPVPLRASRVNYDPYMQVVSRVAQYRAMGHPVSKVEVIVMGGTFTALPLNYQYWFILNVYRALNDYPVWSSGSPSGDLEVEELRNEDARARVVALTIETRPDFAYEKQANWMLSYGATRVELGVQSIYDDVLARVKRGHGVAEVVKSTRILKDSAYKVCYHVMPGLPGSDPDRDLAMVDELFSNPDFKPDCVKIYPTLVVPGTELYEMWRRGEYRSYDTETWLSLLAKMLARVPRWVRVMRFGRDIPLHWVVDGPRIGNLREEVWGFMARMGLRCVEIRCREVGHRILERGEPPRPSRLWINRINYEASGGEEVYLEVIDDEDTLYGILRLRIPNKPHRPELRGRVALVRELHVYGPQVAVGGEPSGLLWWQHRGIGRALMAKAEEVALEYGASRVFVISGVGVRGYYRLLGYRRYPGSIYMYKDLRRAKPLDYDLGSSSSDETTAGEQYYIQG